MQLDCNIHAASFVKGFANEDIDYIDELIPALGLSGLFNFRYSYPLSTEASFQHELTPEMTGEDLLVLARADYERIYKEEEGDVGNPGHIPGMLNRSSSAGRYGVWGHDFSDLYFEGVKISQKFYNVDFSMGS
jgi:hypothetical protein